MTTRNPRLGYTLILVASALFGVNAGVSRIPIAAGLDVPTYTTARITGAFLVFVLIAALVRPAALRVPERASILPIIGLGIVGVTMLQWTYNLAIVRLPLGIALLIEYLGPVLVVVWVKFVWREPVHARVWPAIGIALVGLGLVGQVWAGLTLDGWGVLAAFAAAVCFATYFVLGERITSTGRTKSDPLQTMVWAFGAGTVVMNVISPVWGAGALANDASLLGRFDATTVPAWTAMLYVVVGGTVVPFFLFLASMQHLSSQTASVVAMSEPIAAAIVGWLWFFEVLTTVQLLGVAAVLAGIITAQTARAHVTNFPGPTARQ